MNKNIVAIIPARGGSKGLPRKNVMDFCGKPLVAWSVVQSLNSRLVNQVFVTTDNKEIARIASQYGAIPIQRPPELATDTATTESAILHALGNLRNEPDLIVYLQPTSPLRMPDDIDNAIEFVISDNADSLFSASTLDDFCAWELVGGKPRSLTYDYQNRGRRQERKTYYLENGSIYVFKPSVIKKHNNRLGDNISIYSMPFWQSYEIDEPKDVEVCEYYMNNKLIKLYG